MIEYSIPKASDITIRIYNILGQVVKTYKDNNLQPGYYNYLWTGRNEIGKVVSSGVYLYQLQADGFFDVKKMVLLK